MKNAGILSICAVGAAMNTALAQENGGTIQITCGAMAGTAYYNSGSLLGPPDGGWEQDGINGETVIRFSAESSAVDFSYKDSTGIWAKPEDHNGFAMIHAFNASPFSMTVVVSYPGSTLESYLLTAQGEDAAELELIYSKSRNTAISMDAAVMTGSCKMIAFN